MTTWQWTTAWLRAGIATREWARADDDRGEGVISVGIAVLIMAFLGAAMWLGFKGMWDTTQDTTNTKVQQIGDDGP
jgi:hypothetical protein